jgi:hypothetical protein
MRSIGEMKQVGECMHALALMRVVMDLSAGRSLVRNSFQPYL